jgi:uncharacterized Fe-S cluster protein YjdI
MRLLSSVQRCRFVDFGCRTCSPVAALPIEIVYGLGQVQTNCHPLVCVQSKGSILCEVRPPWVRPSHANHQLEEMVRNLSPDQTVRRDRAHAGLRLDQWAIAGAARPAAVPSNADVQ